MTKQEARKRMVRDGLTYGDAVMLVASFVPEGDSKIWEHTTQEQVKEWTLGRLQELREAYGTSDINFDPHHFYFGIDLLREFG